MSREQEIMRANRGRLVESILGRSESASGNSLYRDARERAEEALKRLSEIDLEALEICIRLRGRP